LSIPINLPIRALFNHVGYDGTGPKSVLVEAPADVGWVDFELVDVATGACVAAVAARFVGGVDGWSPGPWWRVDLDALVEPGRYALRWRTADGGSGHSETITIRADRDQRSMISDIVYYFKGQRCTGVYDAADANATRIDDGTRHDAHGGWYDASGDTSKYLSHLSYAAGMNPQQTPLVVWTLVRCWHLYRAAGAHPYFLERLRDEAAHGADWLMRMQDEAGWWHMTVFDGWSKDPGQRRLCTYRTQAGDLYDGYRCGWRQGGGMAVAALALASTLDQGGEFDNDRYLSAARSGFHHLVEHGDRYRTHSTDDDPDETVLDDTCAALAACELALIDADPVVTTELARRVASLISRVRSSGEVTWLVADSQEQRSFFHASDAGLPIVALSRVADALPGHELAEQAGLVAAGLVDAQLALGGLLDNPFGYPPHWVMTSDTAGHPRWFFPHRNPSGYWWQGENARLASLAAAAFGVDNAGGSTDARHAAWRWIDWILGANPFDVCMLQGRGRNNPIYCPPFDNAPGGVANGITAGLDNEREIEFAPDPWADDPLQNWRWAEQWMPHAAWLMYALALSDSGGVA
jgi:hypothetical protein